MIAIDTNLLVRYFTQDGEEAPLATRFLESECSDNSPGFICLIVLCELVWVLDRAYGYDRKAITAILSKLISVREFEIEDSQSAWQAIGDYQAGTADFADYLIARVGAAHEATPLCTLDRKAARHRGFRLISAN